MRACDAAQPSSCLGIGPSGRPSAAAGGASAERLINLRGLVASKNELIKQLIDQMRHMLECMSMWEAQKAQLERARQQAER